MTDHTAHAACAAEIVALINASPSTPGVDEIAAIIAKATAPPPSTESPLLATVQRSIARLKDLYEKVGDVDSTADDAALEALGAQCPMRPSLGDLAALALIARWIGQSRDGPMPDDYRGDIFGRNAWHVIEAALRAVGLDPCKATGVSDGGSTVIDTEVGMDGGSVAVMLADDFEDTVCKVRQGVIALCAMRSAWLEHAQVYQAEDDNDREFFAGLTFWINSVNAILDGADKRLTGVAMLG
jgi:hypothetical protein